MSSFVSVGPSLNEKPFIDFDRKLLQLEPSLLTSSHVCLEQYGGHISRRIWKVIQERYEYPLRRAYEVGLREVLDVRVHHLMPGHLADVPGWHSDGVPYGGHTGQPNYSLVHPLAFNVSLLLSSELAGVSGVEFVRDPIKPQLYDTDHVFRNVHSEVERIKPRTQLVTDGWAAWYSPYSVYRELPAHRAGTRLIFRLRMMEKPMYTNQAPRQLQVYVPTQDHGK